MQSLAAEILEVSKRIKQDEEEEFFSKRKTVVHAHHTIVAWVNYDDVPPDGATIGGLGGWVRGEGWRAFRKHLRPWEISYYNALRDYVKANNLWKGGFWHQNEGCPVFEDNTSMRCTFRSWGDVMAAIHNSLEGCHHYSYVNFAWEDGVPYFRQSWNKRVARKKELDAVFHNCRRYKSFEKKLKRSR